MIEGGFRPKSLGLQYMLLLLNFFTFFENPKKRDYVFCFASHVFSNYDCNYVDDSVSCTACFLDKC